MRKLALLFIILVVVALSVMACKTFDAERDTPGDVAAAAVEDVAGTGAAGAVNASTASAVITGSAIDQPETESQILIRNLDKVTDETIRYAYENSAENIVVENMYGGDFTGSGKPELLVIFKLLKMPHAGGLDCSVTAVYDRASLDIITQKTFQYDECKFEIVKDETNKSYLLFAGSVTYQGYSQYSLGLWKAGKTWSNLYPSDPSNNIRKFELRGNGTVWVSRFEHISPETQEVVWLHEYDLAWNPKTCTLDESIPFTYRDENGNPNVNAVSVSPNEKYAIVTQPDKYKVRIYDALNNTLYADFEMLAQDYGFLWSPDSKKVCVTRAARIWISSGIIEVDGKRAYDLAASTYDFKAKGVKLNYELDQNRPDPYITPIEWSPDSLKLLMFYQWTDSDKNRQSGTFVFDVASGGISKITQNKADPEGGNIPAQKPVGFKW